MKISKASQFAKALFLIGEALGQEEKTGEDLQLISQAIRSELKLKEVFEKKKVPFETKQKVIKEIFRGKVEPLVEGFIQLLISVSQEHLISEITKEYAKVLYENKRKALVEVITAVPLAEKELEKVERKVRSWLGQEVILRPRVDPSLIGGVVIKAGDKLIDASVRKQLSEAKRNVLLKD
jgi:F-type H+-transporting ATPase subunit delta